MPMEWVSKPVVVEVVQYDGDNLEEIREFVGEDNMFPVFETTIFSIRTIDGINVLSTGDYVIKEGNDILSPLRPEVFTEKYERHLIRDEKI